jgi:hypothetical protein
MKRNGSIIWALFAACVFLLALTACEQPAPPGVPQGEVPGKEEAPEGKEEEQQDQDQNPSARMTGILISSPPETLYYAINQPFDETGLIVEGLYDNDTSRILEAGEYTLSAVDTSISKPLRVRVSVGAFSDSFPILVNNSSSVLQSISASAPGGVVVRELGKPLGTEGITVTGHYNDGDRALDMFSVRGYDRAKRGTQTVTLSVNGKTAQLNVRVKVPADAEVSATVLGKTGANPIADRNTVFIRGQPLSLAVNRFHASVSCNNVTAVLVSGDGINADTDIQGFNPNTPGKQDIYLKLDDKTVPLGVYVTDIEPEVYFDYGFMRHQGDLEGVGASNRNTGSYHASPGKTLVLSPVRVLIGYNADNSDGEPSYSWTVTPPGGNSYTSSGEFLTLNPQAAGTWQVSVTVTGRNFITGSNVSKTAATQVICDAGSLTPGTFPSLTKHFSPGQFTESGTGAGWSLGSFGGYLIAKVNHKAQYTIIGNPFGTWEEPGVIWVQEDNNNNGLPDEMWYELNVGSRPDVTRRYSLKYFKYGDGSMTNEYGQIIRDIYWVDNAGRTGTISGGWPHRWGVSNANGAWVTYTGTLLGVAGDTKLGLQYINYWDNCVDTFQTVFPVSAAIASNGNAVSLTNVRFLKVHTGVLSFGSALGEVSTEVDTIDGISTRGGGL